MLSSDEHRVYHLIPLFLLPVALVLWITKTLRTSTSHLPGPWHTKWTGLVPAYYWLTGQKTHWIHELHKTYGPVVRVSPNVVDICDVDAAREIYTVKETYIKSEFYKRLNAPGVANVFSVRDTSLHRRYRRLLSGPMSESSLKQMYPVIKEKISLAIQRMGEEMQTCGVADVYKWWLFMATDVIGELSFGDSFRMLERGAKTQYALDLESVGFVGAMRASFPTLVYAARFVPLPLFKKASDATMRMIHYAETSLRRHQDLELADPDNAMTTLFSKVYKAKEDDQLAFGEMRDNAMAYIVAGSDTTANTLTYLVWSVCRQLEIKEMLVRELRTLPKEFGDQELKRLPYLNNVIDESLRLYAPAPATLPRVVPPGGASLAGHFLSEGTDVSSQAYSLHRDPATFPDPEVFRPERWERPTKEMKDAFYAFGGGSRICLGIHLARMELRLATAQFFRRFPDARISEREGMNDGEMEAVIYQLLSPKGKRCLVEG